MNARTFLKSLLIAPFAALLPRAAVSTRPAYVFIKWKDLRQQWDSLDEVCDAQAKERIKALEQANQKLQALYNAGEKFRKAQKKV